MILVGLLWQQIQAKTPDTVDLIGTTGLELDPQLSESAKTELAWASHFIVD